jgi:hypothetical protein
MTLIVAGISGPSIWMVGDTAITGGTIGLREREFMPKIEVGKTFPALLGFAGGADHGSQTARTAAAVQTPQDALKVLTTATRDADVQFVYAWFDAGVPMLYNVDKGTASQCPVLHIGSNTAFEVFQKIRHGEMAPYAPKAFKNFMCAAKIAVPDGLSGAIHSMIDTFAARVEHDVGGWAVPYILTAEGAFFCGYSYSVSDPVFDKLVPGSLIPHGTPEGGGTTLSVTGLPNDEGMVVYWMQLPGGLVVLRGEAGYSTHDFRGGPTEFKDAVRAALSRDVDVWAGDQPLGPPHHLKIVRGEHGRLDVTIADHGNGLTFAVHNMSTQFQYDTDLSLGREGDFELPQGISLTRLSHTSIELDVSGGKVVLDVHGLAAMMARLAEMRANLRPEVSADLSKVTLVAQVDPGWRTYPSLHPGLDGLTLNLRHSGYGWLGFVLPYTEARNLGRWLYENAAANLKTQETGGDYDTPD